jgi:CheY-like chemotaxis protein
MRVRAARQLRIVVADNDPDALELVVTDLRLEGHDVVEAVLNGPAALAACAARQPDVLVVDHRMPPGPNGVDVAEALSREGSPIRVIVYSNYRDRDVVLRVRAAGATFLPKGSLHGLRRAVAG